jgi:hypothetical protein
MGLPEEVASNSTPGYHARRTHANAIAATNAPMRGVQRGRAHARRKWVHVKKKRAAVAARSYLAVADD